MVVFVLVVVVLVSGVVLVGWGGLELPPVVEAYIGALAVARCGGGLKP